MLARDEVVVTVTVVVATAVAAAADNKEVARTVVHTRWLPTDWHTIQHSLLMMVMLKLMLTLVALFPVAAAAADMTADLPAATKVLAVNVGACTHCSSRAVDRGLVRRPAENESRRIAYGPLVVVVEFAAAAAESYYHYSEFHTFAAIAPHILLLLLRCSRNWVAAVVAVAVVLH